MPSGTMELVVNLHEDELPIYDASRTDHCKRFSGAVVCGAYGKPFVIDTREHVSVMGVHFKPGGAFPFLGAAASELADSHVDLESLWGTSDVELRERLCAAILSSSSVASSSAQKAFNSLVPIRALQVTLRFPANRSCWRRRAVTTRSRICAEVSPVRSAVISRNLTAGTST